MLVICGDIDFLLAGDVGGFAEQTIIDSRTPLAAEVRKLAHHGSKYSSSRVVLEAFTLGIGNAWAWLRWHRKRA